MVKRHNFSNSKLRRDKTGGQLDVDAGAGMAGLMRSWPSDASPALSTGIMNHINKDSRPDLLERINVEVEPGGGRTALNQNEENTGKKGEGTC